ncbi:MAG: Type II/IV secretion system protein TadC, associated with Flp pilus assembly [Hydrogenibacillus schlegelii]|uniref:Type II/IV secretion system protein TadC, associated with Flp pilus assembly n=1 Tax=Hydrogenibacillus schlegelii TaxID=1484 RepID=A0A2T5G7R5_HYDSH|nr:type II secretion system F family protein [Hydrogenibacillus schlegelii]PTQ52233.1 MAG: Type II/IV secretion system protein TadC, associated with Flp pilus assembly [Hydrogenibacillus schlegelii]
MAELLIAVSLGLGVLSFVDFDRYRALFRPQSFFRLFLFRMHELYLNVPLYRNSFHRTEEAYRLLGIGRPAWSVPAALWTAGFGFVLLALASGEPVLILPGFGLIFYLPTWSRNQLAKYRKGLSQGLMEFVDLVAVGVTAGLPLTSALEHVASSSQTIFFREMAKVMTRVQQGQSLRDRLMDLTRYNKSQEFATFIEQLSSLYETGGMNASEILMGISKHLREMYTLRMEKEVETIQLKMILPLFLSLIGALILIGGPVVLYVSRYMFSGGGGLL